MVMFILWAEYFNFASSNRPVNLSFMWMLYYMFYRSPVCFITLFSWNRHMCFCVYVDTTYFIVWRTTEDSPTQERMDCPTTQTEGKCRLYVSGLHSQSKFFIFLSLFSFSIKNNSRQLQCKLNRATGNKMVICKISPDWKIISTFSLFLPWIIM